MSAPPRIDGYAVGDQLGEGAHATVWAATDERGEPVAIKVLRYREDDLANERMAREARALRELDHPNVVRLLGSGHTRGGFAFLAMERLDGDTLRARLASSGRLSEADAWSVVRPIADAVAAAHERGVLHRDLTSANVVFDARGVPRLTDFGLAKRVSDPAVSRDGASTGTPAYMAPEQWWGADLDERTDVYGLGALLYEVLTGVPPWHGEDAARLIHQVATAAPKPPADRGAELSESVGAFLRRCLSRDPAERPPDVAAFSREGAVAFGVRRGGAAEPWIWMSLVGLAPLAMGYGGSRQPQDWLHESGFAGYGVLVAFALGLALAARQPNSRPVAPLLPLLFGALGFATGMFMVGVHVAGLRPEARFETFHHGVAEASASLFIGAVSSAAIATWVATRDAGRWARVRVVEWVLASVIFAAGLAALDVGAALTGALASALILRGVARRPSGALAAGAAVLSFGAASWVRVVSDASRLFGVDELDRSARALALTRLDRVEMAVIGSTLVASLAVLGFARWRGARAWPRRRMVVGALGASLTLASVVVPWRSMQVAREEEREALASHFGVWSELEPPSGEGASLARLGLSVQLGRRQVTVDGEPVVPTPALETRTGRLVLAQRLGPALSLGRAPELVLTADRSTPWRRVEGVLRVAAELGVTDVDLLLLPGEPLRSASRGPPEAAIVLPRDLRALPIVISVEAGRTIEPDAVYAAAVSSFSAGQRVRVGSSGDQ